ncbi:AAA family ATPase [Clostridium sp. ZS1]|uniref:AAA family ATPase n=1 Tax=Clostridium sp. ZS1 TaxID=2949989 RepID=UPI00338F6409
MELSKGKQKQFELSIAFAHHPKILIMDEPTSNLDPLIRNEFIELLQENMEKEETTVFYSTHITSDLDKSADYIVFIDEGKVILQGEKVHYVEPISINPMITSISVVVLVIALTFISYFVTANLYFKKDIN